jgi:hypothetical protein
METPPSISWLTTNHLSPVVHQLLDEPVILNGDWSAKPLTGGARDTLGIWRVAGTAACDDGDRPWSLVQKGYPSASRSAPPSASDSPLREAELYRSGLLEDLPGVSAPSCYGTLERDGDIWVWLEDLSSIPQPAWTLERFAALARAMGIMNGAWLSGRPLPEHRCLSQRWLEGWMAANDDIMATFAERKHPFWVTSPDIAPVYLHPWNNRHKHLERLAAMPQTFSHLDAHAKNVLVRPRDGSEELVIIDWSFAGLAAPGEELAALVASSVIFVPSAFPMRDAIESTSFPAYLDGLRDTGWDGRDDDVWTAYRSSLVLRYGPGQVRLMPQGEPGQELRLAIEATFGQPYESLVTAMKLFSRWIADRITDTS